MRRWKVLAALGVLVLSATPVLRADDGEGQETKWDWFGGLRVRPEYVDNISDVSLGRDDKIGFIGYRANLGTQVTLDRDVKVLFDLQGLGQAGEDYTPIAGGQTLDFRFSHISLYRAYIEANQVFGENLNFRLGRQEIALGDEWLMGNNDFYAGLSFDALRADLGNRPGTLTLIWAKVADYDNPEFFGNFAFQDTTGDFDLYAAYESMKFGDDVKLDLGVLYKLDHTSLVNIGGPAFTDKRFTYTAYFAYEPPTGFFGVANLGKQNGKTADATSGLPQDIGGAEAYELTAGFKWERNGRMARVHARLAGYSGDDPATAQVETFDPLAQDFHNRYGMLDFWNGIWGHQQYIGGTPGLNVIQVMFETEIPNGITLSGVAQRLTRDTRVNPTSDNRNLGQEWGIAANYKYGNNMTLDFCFAQLFPGTAIGLEPPLFGKSTVRRLYVGATAKF